MVAQGDFVAVQGLGFSVQAPPPHPGAEKAGVLFLGVDHFKNVALKQRIGNPQQLGVAFHLRAVFRVVAGVHDQVFRLEGKLRVPVQQLDQLCQQHGVLAAGNAYADFVSRLNQPVPLH